MTVLLLGQYVELGMAALLLEEVELVVVVVVVVVVGKAALELE